MVAALATLATTSACGRCGPEPGPQGSLSLAWSIVDPDRDPITCERIGATEVLLTAKNQASGATTSASFPCTASPGVQLVAPGTYDVTIALRDGSGAVIATAADQLGAIVVVDQLTPLAPVTFSVRASLVLSVIASSTTANCSSVEQSGAGITGSTLTLEFVRGGCAAATFVRGRGATTTLETYTVNCSSPRIARCIERDETFTVPSLAPGSYLINVRGKVGAVDCWAASGTVDVGLGVPVLRTLTLTPSGLAGCPRVQAPALPDSDAGP
jgi:hypothetical protein